MGSPSSFTSPVNPNSSCRSSLQTSTRSSLQTSTRSSLQTSTGQSKLLQSVLSPNLQSVLSPNLQSVLSPSLQSVLSPNLQSVLSPNLHRSLQTAPVSRLSKLLQSVVSPNLGIMEGNFVLKSNENYDAFLKTIGVPAELAAKMVAAVPKLEVSRTGSGLTIKTTAGDKVFSNTIEYGKDCVVDVAGLKYTINVKETATGYSGTMVMGGKSGTVCVEKTADGSCQTMSIGGVVTKRHYKKE